MAAKRSLGVKKLIGCWIENAKDNSEKEKFVREKVALYEKYFKSYPERIKDSAQRHRKTDKGYYSTYRGGAVRRGYSFELNHDEFVRILLGECVYCGAEKAMGIDRVDNEIGYTSSNSVACCAHCNRMKWAHSKEFFFAHILKIAHHNNMV
jgi:hypothetical protein